MSGSVWKSKVVRCSACGRGGQGCKGGAQVAGGEGRRAGNGRPVSCRNPSVEQGRQGDPSIAECKLAVWRRNIFTSDNRGGRLQLR